MYCQILNDCVLDLTLLLHIEASSHVANVLLESICIIDVTELIQLRKVRILTFEGFRFFELNLFGDHFACLSVVFISFPCQFKLMLFLISDLL